MPDNKPSKILIIDDEHMIRQTLKFVLKKEGYEIIEAEDAEKGIIQVEQGHPDLIIIDYYLPAMNGWEATRKIRSMPGFQLTPIIGYTAYNNPETRQIALSNGLNEILSKPIDVDELKRIVADYLSRKD